MRPVNSHLRGVTEHSPNVPLEPLARNSPSPRSSGIHRRPRTCLIYSPSPVHSSPPSSAAGPTPQSAHSRSNSHAAERPSAEGGTTEAPTPKQWRPPIAHEGAKVQEDPSGGEHLSQQRTIGNVSASGRRGGEEEHVRERWERLDEPDATSVTS